MFSVIYHCSITIQVLIYYFSPIGSQFGLGVPHQEFRIFLDDGFGESFTYREDRGIVAVLIGVFESGTDSFQTECLELFGGGTILLEFFEQSFVTQFFQVSGFVLERSLVPSQRQLRREAEKEQASASWAWLSILGPWDLVEVQPASPIDTKNHKKTRA